MTKPLFTRYNTRPMKLLQQINSPEDLRRLSVEQTQEVADEIRAYILETMSRVGGHTGASLGAVELATAAAFALTVLLTIERLGLAAAGWATLVSGAVSLLGAFLAVVSLRERPSR